MTTKLAGDDSAVGPISAAFVCPGWPPDAFANGIIPYVADVVGQMRQAGHRSAVLAQQLAGAPIAGEVVDVSAHADRPGLARRLIDSMAYRVLGRFPSRARAPQGLIAACRGLIADRGLQIVEMEESFGWVRAVQKGLPIPVVVRLHGPWFLNGPLQGAEVDSKEYRERVRVEGEAIREARAITSASLDVLERTRAHYGIPLPEARVIYPSTRMIPAAERWSDREAEPGTIVFVGRFDRHKGGDLVIDAFAKIAARHPEARLRFVGPDYGLTGDDGRRWEIEPYLRYKLGDLATSGRVEWVGKQPGAAIPAIRRKAAVVVVGSRYDNFPVTVLEAMAMGCPLVAPRIGGIPEIVEDGVNGLLFEAGRSDDMAEKVGRLLDDRPLAVRLGERAGVDVEARHDPRFIAGQVADFFREVITNRVRSAVGETI